MLNGTQGQVGYVVIIGLLLLILLILGGVGYYLYKTDKLDFLKPSREIIKTPPKTRIILDVIDFISGASVPSKIIIKSSSNNTVYFQEYEHTGRYTSFEVSQNTTYEMFATSDICYGVRNGIGIAAEEQRVVTINCPQKEDNLIINLYGSMDDYNINDLTLAINGSKFLRNYDVCFAWSIGVVDVSIPNHLNLTRVPSFIKREADKCIYADSSFDKDVKHREFNLKATTKELKEEDWIRVYIIDRDRFYNYEEKEFEYGRENEKGEDIGSNTFFKFYLIRDINK